MKECIRCKIKKKDSEFYKKKANKMPYGECKECMNIRTIVRRNLFKQKCVDYKGGKCEYSKSYKALEFHHKEPDKKDFCFGSIQVSIISAKIKNELDKCMLVCANCHREEHDRLWREKSLNTKSAQKLFSELKANYNIVSNPTKGTRKFSNCKDCNIKIYFGGIQCFACRKKNPTLKGVQVSTQELALLVWTKPMRDLAKDLGVTDRCLKKRCIRLGIGTPKQGYWSKR